MGSTQLLRSRKSRPTSPRRLAVVCKWLLPAMTSLKDLLADGSNWTSPYGVWSWTACAVVWLAIAIVARFGETSKCRPPAQTPKRQGAGTPASRCRKGERRSQPSLVANSPVIID